jgi:hypothetical protein
VKSSLAAIVREIEWFSGAGGRLQANLSPEKHRQAKNAASKCKAVVA